MEQKKYQSIVRLGHRTTVGVLNEGDFIVVQEKLDGANASFRKDGDVIRVYSRNLELNEENNLGGFYQWVQESIDINTLVDTGVYFGEWMNPHKIKYPNYQEQFFLYDVYDTETERYIEFNLVRAQAKKLNVNLIPVFYMGEYKSFEHLESFVGKTLVGGQFKDREMGEGIVVKNVDYIDRYGRQVFVKLVSDEFREVQKQKPPKDPSKVSEEQIFVNTTVTEARVDKFLHKFVDEGILDENWGIEDMGTILRNLGGAIFDDIIKEESDMLPKEYEEKLVKRAIGKTLPQIVKKIIDNNNR